VSKNWQDITIALAGVFQAAAMVEQIAKTGYAPPEAYKCSIESMLDLNPASTLAVYGGNVENLRTGLEVMRELLRPNSQKHRDTLRYGLGVLHLQKKLAGRRDMLGVIGSRLEQVAQQAQHFSTTHDNVISNLGTLYTETLSTFRFRIQVNGDYNYLQQQRIANQIRALLLASVRSAILWRQVGGNRLQLLFYRKHIAEQVDNLLRRI
jgi:high frequency lysogenization protein